MLAAIPSAWAFRTARDSGNFDDGGTAPIVWRGGSVEFVLATESVPPGLDVASVQDALAQAAGAWQGAACGGLSIVVTDTGAAVPEPGDMHNTIAWVEDWSARGFEPSAAGQTDLLYERKADGWAIAEADIYLNAESMSWSLAGSAQVRDVSAVVTHELGHALGLLHPCEPSGQGGAPDCDAAGPSIEGATMFPLYDPDQASLAEDDAAGICSLYPETAPCGGCPDQKVCRAGECVALDPERTCPDAGCVGMSCEDDTACGSLASCVQGTCRRGAGQLGDRCAASADCDHGVCVGGFCQPECSAAVSCAHGDCREALEPALSGCVESREYPVGASCRTADDCSTGLCVSLGDDSRCTQTCAADGSCPAGWACTAIDGRDVCVTRAFTASGGTGCALSARSDTTGPLWVLGLTVAVCGWRRRKSSIQHGGGRMWQGILKIVRVASACLLLGSLIACSGPERPKLSLDVSGSEEIDASAEEQWLRDQQLVRVIYPDGTLHEDPVVLLFYHPTFGGEGIIATACASAYPTNESMSGCEYVLNTRVYKNICIAKTALAAANVQSTPLELTFSNGDVYKLPPQSEETSAAIVERGVYYARVALEVALDEVLGSELGVPGNPPTGQQCASLWNTQIGGRTMAGAYASAAAEAYYTAKDMYDRAVEANLNVSDKLRSSTVSPILSAARGTSGSALSRAAAAHLLVGGDAGLLGSTTKGLCLDRHLSPQAQSALQVLRDSGVAPASLSQPVPTLLDGAGGGTGSVRQRLGAFYGHPEFVNATTAITSFYKLDVGAFTEARDYLAQEVGAFARSARAQLTPASGAPAYKRYSATATEPRELPTGAWAARARYNAAAPSAYMYRLIGNGAETGLNQLMWRTVRSIRRIISLDSFTGAARSEVMGPLATLISGEDYLGALELFRETDGDINLTAWGFASSDALRIVRGEDGLRCAVQGDIEGADCGGTATSCPADQTPTLACLTVATFGATSTTSLSEFGTTQSVSTTFSASSMDPKERLYVVRPKTTAIVPGNFTVVAGFTPAASGVVPVVPSIENRVAEILKPSRQNCAVPEVSCAGWNMDARLPLEDELSEDANGVESSWRRYLDLAKQAAAEADTLGQDYLNANMQVVAQQANDEIRLEEQRRRAEESLLAVQSACGTAIDSRRLLSLISGSNGNDMANAALSQACPCPAGYACMAGKCIVDLKSLAQLHSNDPELGKLASCLNPPFYEFVSLGNRPLCVQVNNQNPNKLCETTSASGCPFVKTGTSCGTPPSGTRYAESFPLGYFEQNAANAGTPCDDLAELRTTPTALGGGAYQRLLKSNVMNPVRLRDLTPELGWKGQYGGFSTMMAGGEARYSTGSHTAGPANVWPCGAGTVTIAGCTTARQKSFFCAQATCTNAASRMNMNLRMYRAAAAAEFMLQHEIINVPGRPDTRRMVLGNWALPVPGGSCGVGPLTYHYQGNIPIAACDDTFVARSTVQPGADGWYTLQPNGTALRVPGETGIKFVDTELTKNEDTEFQDRKLLEFFSGLYEPAPGGHGWAYRHLTGKGRPDETPHFELVVGDDVGSLMPAQVIDNQAYLDGLELLCRVSNERALQRVTRPVSLATLESIDAAGDYLQSLAQAITNKAASSVVFARVPAVAADAMREASSNGAFPALGGRMAEEVARLREHFLVAAEAGPVIGSAINQMGAELKALRARMQQADVAQELADWQLASSTLDRLTECGSTLVDGIKQFSSFGARAVITCANAAAQIGIAVQVNSLQKLSVELGQEIDTANFAERMSQLTESLQTTALRLSESWERIDATLASIEGLRKDAESNLARAVYLSSWNSEKQAEFNRAAGTLAVAKQLRYYEALRNARLMAFVAKRAIEQRLGMRLADMGDHLPLVIAPKIWEGSICTLGGINYAKLTFSDVNSYTDGFVGDYVTKLENVVESYRMAFNFHEGEDVAVISLRDDVINVRKPCEVPSRNLLRNSDKLESASSWFATGCLPVTYQGATRDGLNCIAPIVAPTPRTTTDMISPKPFPAPDSDLSGTMGYQVVFGDGNNCAAGLPGGPCGWQSGAAWVQRVALEPGKYRLSWYTAETLGTAAQFVTVRPAAGGAPLSLTAGTALVTTPPAWNRYSVTFEVTNAGEHLVGFTSPSSTLPTARMTIAAPMLEGLPPSITNVFLPAFEKTNAEGEVTLPACQDTEGDLFRSKYFQRKCVRLCGSGFNNNCTDGPLHCYRELLFGVTQSWIQNGRMFNYSGFARGNFNYRIDGITLNFVGSNTRDCENSNAPDACYSAAFIPYSLRHDGPFFVRNHLGEDFRAWLFDGRIEHARGLAAERYLTNPLGPSDRELLTDYWRTELQGRPLDGNFLLRVWEDPGVNFDGIQDVQLMLKYRYWTRFD